MTEPSNIGTIMDDLNPATGKLVETEANKWVCSDTMWSPLGTGKLVWSMKQQMRWYWGGI